MVRFTTIYCFGILIAASVCAHYDKKLSVYSKNLKVVKFHHHKPTTFTKLESKEPKPSTSHKLRGVNLGGWLVLERWLTPSVFKGIPEDFVDEWEFCKFLGKSECLNKLFTHWANWVKYEDLVKLKEAGVNLIRIPVGYWSFDLKEDEPYVQGAKSFLITAIQYAYQLGLKVMIDFHGLPGSQNGFDNSGRKGAIRWTWEEGTLERSLTIVDKIIDEILVPFDSWGVIHSFELVNEPAGWGVNMTKLAQYYKQGYQKVQSKLPNLKIVMHDAFKNVYEWQNLPIKSNWKQAIVDTHIYHLFNDAMLKLDYRGHLNLTRQQGHDLAHSPYPFLVGEWSLATAKCRKWNHDETKCLEEVGPMPFTPAYREFLSDYFDAQVKAYEDRGQGWVFWNFKTETSKEWSYLDGLKEGWIRKLLN